MAATSLPEAPPAPAADRTRGNGSRGSSVPLQPAALPRRAPRRRRRRRAVHPRPSVPPRDQAGVPQARDAATRTGRRSRADGCSACRVVRHGLAFLTWPGASPAAGRPRSRSSTIRRSRSPSADDPALGGLDRGRGQSGSTRRLRSLCWTIDWEALTGPTCSGLLGALERRRGARLAGAPVQAGTLGWPVPQSRRPARRNGGSTQ
jgi:hypothetical protein